MENLLLNNEIDFNQGLSQEDIDLRVKNGQTNKMRTKTSKSYFQIIVKNVFTWFNILCFAIAGILIYVGSYENLSFILIFLANLLIGLIQEIRAKNVVDKISVISAKKIEVLRQGKKKFIETEKIVKDDILFFGLGNQIIADCVVIEGTVNVNEGLITGESKPIKKSFGDTLYGGSFVVSGNCKCQAIKVGTNTYSASLVKKARELKSNKSEILKTLNFIIRVIGIILIPLGILTYLDLIHGGESIANALIKTSASTIAIMPVGMFLLTSTSLVVGVIKLARQKTLVQDIYCIENLARVDILCLDKTGTLTDGTMTVTNVFPIHATNTEIKDLMQRYLAAANDKNQTQIALENFFGKKSKTTAKSIISFSSEKKYSAVTFENDETYILGAPEFATKELDKDIKQNVKDLTTQGLRVVLLCKNANKIKKDEIKIDSTPLAIISIQDNIRPDAKETLAWFNENGVQIKIISGDNVDTVRTISKNVGVEGTDKYISLDGMADDEVANAALNYNIFGRVTPEQKCIIVKTLRAQGHRVAMTGDGVNDILAIKEADCSIAMAGGSEATRSASDLIMLNNNFSSMPKVVAEGRRVIHNISKTSSLFLTKTFFAMFLTIFVLFIPPFNYPLQPNQILLWETLFIGIPAFFLALQPNNKKVSGSYISSLASKTLPGALVLFLATIACYIYCSITNSPQILATLISYAVTIGAFFILLNLCLPLDIFRSVLCFTMLGTYIVVMLIIPQSFFNYSSLVFRDFGFLIVTWFCVCIAYSLLKKLFEILFKKDIFKIKPIAKNK